jgi:RNA polymerase sigma-70 factor, ECF subfamily
MARFSAADSIDLAFVAGLQHLPHRERAVLLLHDVAGFSTSEVATMLEASERTVNRTLKLARAGLDARLPARREHPPPPHSRAERQLVARFARSFETGDGDAIGELVAADAFLMMPPRPLERRGPDAIAGFLAEQFATRAGRSVRLVWTRANGQPAFGHYIEDPQAGGWRPLGVIVLTLEGKTINGLTRFGDTAVMPRLGLPLTLRS